MKKLILILLSLLLSFSLAACDSKCNHSYDGADDAICNECGETREVSDNTEQGNTNVEGESDNNESDNGGSGDNDSDGTELDTDENVTDGSGTSEDDDSGIDLPIVWD